MVSAGAAHTLALKDDGTVWAWGYNSNGQLGDGTDTDRCEPVQVMIDAVTPLDDVRWISAGDMHSLAVRNDGTVWAWGYNMYGQMGDGTDTDRWNPVQVTYADTTPLDSVGYISSGSYHSMALKTDGTVWTWGLNAYGQLGDDTQTDRWNPVQVTDPNNDSGLLNDVKKVSTGSYHSMALKTDGTVWTWGDNYYGQLGDGNSGSGKFSKGPIQVKGEEGAGILDDVTDVSAGSYFSMALKDDDTVRTWGQNNRGQLGDGTNTLSSTPVQVTADEPEGYLTGAVAVLGGSFHAVVLKDDGTVWTWGNNGFGQLGDGTSNNSTSAVQVTGLDLGIYDPGTGDPGTNDPGTDGPGTDDPETDDPGTDDQGTDDLGTSDAGNNGGGRGVIAIFLIAVVALALIAMVALAFSDDE